MFNFPQIMGPQNCGPGWCSTLSTRPLNADLRSWQLLRKIKCRNVDHFKLCCRRCEEDNMVVPI